MTAFRARLSSIAPDFDRLATALAAGFWLWLAYHQARAAWDSANPVTALLCAESLLVGRALLLRRPDWGGRQPRFVQWVILFAALWGPLLVDARRPEGWLPALLVVLGSALGLLLTLWSLLSLGKAFGVTPADRGLVVSGPYRWLRHPMYAGALLNLLAVVLGRPTPANLLVFGAILASCVWRISLEERCLAGYHDYARRVPWRLLPGVY